MPPLQPIRFGLRMLLAILAMAIALPLTAIVAWQSWSESRAAGANALDVARIVSTNTASRIATILATHRALLERLALRPDIRAMDPKRCPPIVGDFLSLHPETTTVAVRDPQGNAVCSFLSRPIPRLEGERFPWFVEGLRAEGFVASGAFLGQQTGKWVTVLTHPIRDEARHGIGLLVMPLELRTLADQVFAAVPKDVLVVVSDRSDNVLLRSSNHDGRVGKPIPARFVAHAAGRSGGELKDYGIDGVHRIYSFTTVPATGWRVWAALPEETVLAASRERLATSALLIVPVLLLAIAGAWGVGRFISRSIGGLADTAARISRGDLAARAPARGPWEVEEVAQEFNRMLDALERFREERAAVSSHYGQILRFARDIVLLNNPDGRIVEANEAAIAAYGYTREELLSLNVRDLRPEEQKGDVDEQWQLSARPEGVLFEAINRRKDGSTFPVEVSSRVIEIDGRPFRQSFVRDIAARKRAEAEARAWRDRHRMAIEASGLILRECDLHGTVHSITGDTEKILGYGHGELAGGRERWRELIHPEDRKGFDEGLERALAEATSCHHGYRIRRKDGAWLVVQDDTFVLSSPQAGESRMMSFVSDITEKSRAREHIERQLDELRRWHSATVGREARILELKREVNDLLAAAGREPRYESVEGPAAGERP